MSTAGEGTDTGGFLYHGRPIQLALCGDLWDFPQRFHTDGLLIWPVYVDYTPQQWAREEPAYARQAALAAPRTLMVNSLCDDPRAYGGAFFFADGQTQACTLCGQEGILVAEV